MSKFKEKVSKHTQEEIKRILVYMQKEREGGNVSEYKTLSDSLKMFISLESKKRNFDAKDKEFYSIVVSKLELEEDNLGGKSKIILDNREYREHRDWLISYDRVVNLHEQVNIIITNLVYQIRQENIEELSSTTRLVAKELSVSSLEVKNMLKVLFDKSKDDIIGKTTLKKLMLKSRYFLNQAENIEYKNEYITSLSGEEYFTIMWCFMANLAE